MAALVIVFPREAMTAISHYFQSPEPVVKRSAVF